MRGLRLKAGIDIGSVKTDIASLSARMVRLHVLWRMGRHMQGGSRAARKARAAAAVIICKHLV
jgi:hypothetical protein